MELIIDKLGRIEHAEIEIRPLTVFVGENSTNKTWAAYCLWDLARRLMVGNPSGTDARVSPVEPRDVEDAIGAAVARAVAQSPKFIDAAVSIARQDLIQGIDKTVTFRLSSADVSALLHVDARAASAALIATPEEFREEKSVAEVRVDNSLRTVTVSYAGPGVPATFAAQWSPSMGEDPVPAFLTSILTQLAHGFLGRSVLLLLPAERKALVQTYKLLLDVGGAPYGPRAIGQLMAAPALDEYLSPPPIHFMRFLKAAEATPDRTGKATRFAAALEHLEGGILGGAIDYQRRGDSFWLSFVGRDGPPLRMETASSLVRALAGLNVYLRHFANRGDFLIIDELEMNAHPEAQLQLIELVAYLVNRGVRVVLTTHSPFIVDHLANLVEASALPVAARASMASRFSLGTSEAFLDPESVGVYWFKEVGEAVEVVPVFDRGERSIDWQTFAKVSERVMGLYGDLLAAQREAAE